MIGGDNFECLLGQSKCSNVAVIPNKDREWRGLLQHQERIAFEHVDGAVTFSTNLTGAFFLAIVTGFRDVNQVLHPSAPWSGKRSQNSDPF